MSHQDHLMHAKDCLSAGRMTEMRVWLRRAETSAKLDEELEEVRVLGLRHCLVVGQYERGQQLVADAERQKKFPLSIIGPLREALYSAAGWGPLPAEAPADMFALLADMVNENPLAPERALVGLGDWSRLLPCHPRWLDELAARPFPEGSWAGLGQRVLPANAEAALAELWYVSGGQGEYPRFRLLEDNEAESGFAFLPPFCLLLQALSQENIPASLAASDRLFSVSDEGKWLWLRSLDLIRHFGNYEEVTQSLLRLRITGRTLQSQFLGSNNPTPLEEYGPLIKSLVQTIACCPLPLGRHSFSDEEAPTLTERSEALKELYDLSVAAASPAWFAAPGACRMVSRLLEQLRAKDLPVLPAFPDLMPVHKFIQSASLSAPAAAAQWLGLLPFLQREEAYVSLLLKALPAAPEEAVLVCVPVLQRQGMTLASILPFLPPRSCATLFVQKPEPSGLTAAAALPDETLHVFWAALAQAIWALGSQKLKVSERTARESLLGRLTSLLGASQEMLSEEALKELSEWAGNRPAVSEAEINLLCQIGLYLAEMQSWEAAAWVLEQAGEAGDGLRGELTAHHWLATGLATAYQPALWHSGGPWCEMASAWEDLLFLRLTRLSETNPLRAEQTDLAVAWDALATWRDSCLVSGTTKAFTETAAFDALTERWWFLRSLPSWRLLTSSADVLPPIAGVTPQPDRPLLALMQLMRYGTDAATLSAILPPLRTYEPLPASLILGLLEQAYKSAKKSEADRANLRSLLISEMSGLASLMLPAETAARFKKISEALPSVLASPAARQVLRGDQAKETEKNLRLTLQKLEAPDFELSTVLEQIGRFVTGDHFRASSLPQWGMVRNWRKSLLVQGKEFHDRVQTAMPEDYREILNRLLLAPLRPVVIDGSNILRDKHTLQQCEWPMDCLENLWAGLWAHDFYPIITYVDRNEYAEQEHENGPAAKRRLNDLIRSGFIDDDTIVEDGPADSDMSKIGDYRILFYIEREHWQESALIVTNDNYSKPPRKQSEIDWTKLFPWLTKTSFGRMQAKFRYNDGQWLLRLPGGKELPF